MEELPPEVLANIYPYLSPRSYHRFGQTGKKYRELSQEPFIYKQTIRTVKSLDNNWIAKINPFGCENSVTYSSVRDVTPSDLTNNMLKFEMLLEKMF